MHWGVAQSPGLWPGNNSFFLRVKSFPKIAFFALQTKEIMVYSFPLRGISAVGSAQHWQCWGQEFESPMLHQTYRRSNNSFGRRFFVNQLLPASPVDGYYFNTFLLAEHQSSYRCLKNAEYIVCQHCVNAKSGRPAYV